MNRKTLLAGASVAFELVALGAAFLGSAPFQSDLSRHLAQFGVAEDALGIGLALMLHTLAGGLLATSAQCVCDQRESAFPGQGGRRRGLRGLFFFCIAFWMPLIGVFTGFAFLYRSTRASAAVASALPITLTGAPPLADHASALQQRTSHVQSDLAGAVRHAKGKDRRLAMLLRARKLPNRDAIALARIALADEDDEVRLLAYALLNMQEEALQNRIQSLTDQLPRIVPGLRLQYHKALAYYYWEAVYLGLCSGAVESMMLESSMQQVAAAQEIAPLDAGLRLLQGRILLRQGKLNQSALAFNQAVALGIAKQKVAPYLDEVSFRNQRAGARERSVSQTGAESGAHIPAARRDRRDGHYSAAS